MFLLIKYMYFKIIFEFLIFFLSFEFISFPIRLHPIYACSGFVFSFYHFAHPNLEVEYSILMTFTIIMLHCIVVVF